MVIRWLFYCGLTSFNATEPTHCALELLVATLVSDSLPERAAGFGWVTRGVCGLTPWARCSAWTWAVSQSHLKSELHASSKAETCGFALLGGLLRVSWPRDAFGVFVLEWKNEKDLRELILSKNCFSSSGTYKITFIFEYPVGHELLLAFFLEAFLFGGNLDTNIIKVAPGRRLCLSPVPCLEVNYTSE